MHKKKITNTITFRKGYLIHLLYACIYINKLYIYINYITVRFYVSLKIFFIKLIINVIRIIKG